MRFSTLFIGKALLLLLIFRIHECSAQTDNFKHWIQTLTDSSLGGRPAGTQFEKATAQLLEKEIKQLGLKARQQPFRYHDADANDTLSATNIYTYIDHHTDSTILISAHYDHLGKNISKSKEIRVTTFHPGANDNASGVAMLLYLLKTKKQWMSRRYNYVIVFYSAHEPGLFGSTEFYEKIVSKYKFKAVINFDMLGRLYQQQLHVAANAAVPIKDDSLHIIQENEEVLTQLDTKAYHQHGITCYNVSTGLFPEYHTTKDLENRINYDGMVSIYLWLKKWLVEISRP